MLKPRIPPHVGEVIRGLHPDIRRLIREAIRALADNPHLGDPLKRDLEGLWKYRVRRYRIVYSADSARRELLIHAVGHRESIYDSLGRP